MDLIDRDTVWIDGSAPNCATSGVTPSLTQLTVVNCESGDSDLVIKAHYLCGQSRLCCWDVFQGHTSHCSSVLSPSLTDVRKDPSRISWRYQLSAWCSSNIFIFKTGHIPQSQQRLLRGVGLVQHIPDQTCSSHPLTVLIYTWYCSITETQVSSAA